MTTKDDIRGWFQQGQQEGADRLIVVCDTYDHSDYPVTVSDEDFWSRYDALDGKNMQRVMEVYDLHADVDEQLSEYRAFHFPPKPVEATP